MSIALFISIKSRYFLALGIFCQVFTYIYKIINSYFTLHISQPRKTADIKKRQKQQSIPILVFVQKILIIQMGKHGSWTNLRWSKDLGLTRGGTQIQDLPEVEHGSWTYQRWSTNPRLTRGGVRILN
jgi:hypothetical protein